MRSQVADATGNVKYTRKSLYTSPNSVLVLLKASHVVHILFVYSLGTAVCTV